MEILVNNVKLYYEECGSGKPIILLHGNQESHEIFDKLIDKLKDNYKVYAIDSRCHGKSENPIDISYDLMCDDIIDFIKKLHIGEYCQQHKPEQLPHLYLMNCYRKRQ